MKNQEQWKLFAALEGKVHWDRKDKNHIIVWTSGYKTAECHEIERYLMDNFKMTCMSQKFDSLCGKTVSVFKHK